MLDIMAERRRHHTPFRLVANVVVDADDNTVAVFEDIPLARFVVRSCNYYDRLRKAVLHCRGEYESLTQPIRRPAYRDLMTLAAEIEQTETTNGD